MRPGGGAYASTHVLSMIRMALMAGRPVAGTISTMARYLLDRWGIRRSPQFRQHLSGGQKQRVSLSRALVRKPEVYLLDEPIAHLDARLKFSTQSLLKEFASKYRSTIIYVTHDYREALALSDRMVVLRKGTIEQEGSPLP